MKNVYIFDLDGTLLNTLKALDICVNNTLKRLDLKKLEAEIIKKHIGNGARYLIENCVKSVCENPNKDILDSAFKIYKEEFSIHCLDEVEPYPDIVEVLVSLKKAGKVLAILTNKPQVQAVETVEHYFDKDLFDLIQGQSDDRPRKPDPISLELVIESLQVQKQDCAFVGDSEVDVKTGVGCGVFTYGVDWGFRTREELLVEKPNVIISKAKDLLVIE